MNLLLTKFLLQESSCYLDIIDPTNSLPNKTHTLIIRKVMKTGSSPHILPQKYNGFDRIIKMAIVKVRERRLP